MVSKRMIGQTTKKTPGAKALGTLHSSSTVQAMLDPSTVKPGEKALFNFRPALSKLAAGRSVMKFKNDAVVFSQGELADSVFYVQSGKIKITVLSKRGKEAVIAILPEFSFFGEGCLTGQPNRLTTASAVQTSVVIRVLKAEMLGLLLNEPEFSAQFLKYSLGRNARIEADLVDHLFNNSEKRLARLLLILANFGQETDSKPTITKISQDTLAKMIGTTRSRVSFFLNRFRDKGYIKYNGGMHIHNSLVSVLLRD